MGFGFRVYALWGVWGGLPGTWLLPSLPPSLPPLPSLPSLPSIQAYAVRQVGEPQLFINRWLALRFYRLCDPREAAAQKPSPSSQPRVLARLGVVIIS